MSIPSCSSRLANAKVCTLCWYCLHCLCAVSPMYSFLTVSFLDYWKLKVIGINLKTFYWQTEGCSSVVAEWPVLCVLFYLTIDAPPPPRLPLDSKLFVITVQNKICVTTLTDDEQFVQWQPIKYTSKVFQMDIRLLPFQQQKECKINRIISYFTYKILCNSKEKVSKNMFKE